MRLGKERVATLMAALPDLKDPWLLSRTSCFSHSTVTFRVDVLKELGGYNERFVVARENELIWRIIRRGYKVANLPEVLVEYHLSVTGLTKAKRRKQILNKLLLLCAHILPKEALR